MATTAQQLRAARALWFRCLSSGFRMAVACSIVACATLYGPASIRRLVTFPAFSYVTAILIVTNATLGDAIHGCWLALFATIQTVCPAIVVFWFIGPTKFSYETIALTVALASVVVVLPTSTHVLAKRIALGQIVIIYVVGFIGGVHTEPLMHPIHVAATTAMGAAASVCATLLPFPRLASLEVKEKSKAVVENVGERLRLMVKAFVADNDAVAVGSISKALLLSTSATRLLRPIKHYQESLQWETVPFNICRLGWLSGGERLQDLGMPLRGMELALSSIPSYPIEIVQNLALKDGLNALEKHIGLVLKQANGYLPSDSLTFPELNPDDLTINTVESIQIMPTNHQDVPPLFFIFCMKLLQNKCQNKRPTKQEEESKQGDVNSSDPENQTWFSSLKTVVWSSWASQMNSKRLMPALKSAIALGVAVFLGLMYSKENGFWASLGVAVSIASGREATFKVANLKLQGTVLGSVFGVLSFLLFERFLPGRLLCLLPWFVFTSFMQRSRIYGPAGGVSAVIGAVIILGRTNYGSPRELAFARIVETLIGVSSSITVDILLQPTRASTMAKIQLTTSFRMLQKCIDSLSFRSNVVDLEANQKALGMQVSELKKLIDEAEVEPNFWFLPVQGSCYGKLFKSLSKMVDIFAFSAYAMKNLQQNLPITEGSWRKLQENLEGDLEKFKETVNASVTCYADVTSLKSLRVLEKEAEKNDISGDLEKGEQQKKIERDEIEKEKLIQSFLQHSAEVVDLRGDSEDGKSQAILSLSALAFCLSSLMRETEEIGETIRELIQWENPASSNLDLNEITSKIHATKK